MYVFSRRVILVNVIYSVKICKFRNQFYLNNQSLLFKKPGSRLIDFGARHMQLWVRYVQHTWRNNDRQGCAPIGLLKYIVIGYLQQTIRSAESLGDHHCDNKTTERQQRVAGYGQG